MLGLAVPLLIHLLNASSGKRTPFPALQFAVASKARRVRSIALREPLLLALRMAILTLLIGWLAGPTWHAAPDPAAVGPVLVSPLALQLSADEVDRKLIELDVSPASARQLAAGFPGLDEPALYRQPAALALTELAADMPDSATVLVVDHPLDQQWALTDAANASAAGLNVLTLAPGTLLSVALSVGPQREADARYLRAALAALASAKRLRWEELAEIASAPKAVDVWIALGTPAAQPNLTYDLQLRDAPAGDRWVTFNVGGESFKLMRAPSSVRGESMNFDDEGQSLIELVRTDGAPVIHFAGRFNPQFNTLVSRGLFPDLLGQWLNLARQKPQTVKTTNAAASSQLLAALILLLWLVERLWALRSSAYRPRPADAL